MGLFSRKGTVIGRLESENLWDQSHHLVTVHFLACKPGAAPTAQMRAKTSAPVASVAVRTYEGLELTVRLPPGSYQVRLETQYLYATENGPVAGEKIPDELPLDRAFDLAAGEEKRLRLRARLPAGIPGFEVIRPSDGRVCARENRTSDDWPRRQRALPRASLLAYRHASEAGNAGENEDALAFYDEALAAIPETMRPAAKELLLELDMGRAKCLNALGRPDEALEAMEPHLGLRRTTGPLFPLSATDLLGFMSLLFAKLGRADEAERCSSLSLQITLGAPERFFPGTARDRAIGIATHYRKVALTALLETAGPERLLDTLDKQAQLFGEPSNDVMGMAFRPQAMKAFGPGERRLTLLERRTAEAEAAGPLIEAAEAGDLAALTRAAQTPFGVDAGAEGWRTALMAASEAGQAPAVRWLLEHGASPTKTDGHSKTPLMMAAAAGRADVAALLVENGARVDDVDDGLQTPLHLAAAADHARAIETLAAHGAPLDAPDAEGKTPLHVAAEEGAAQAAQALIAAGASLDARASDGATPLLRATRTHRAELCRILRDAGAEA